MKNRREFLGRLGIQQRVLPAYRVPFFDLLARRCEGGLSLYAGQPRQSEAILTAGKLDVASLALAENTHVLSGVLYLCFQSGIVDWLDEWDPSALVLEANPRYPSNRKAMGWMRDKGRPVIGWGLGVGRLSAAWRGFLRRFDALVAYSTQGAAEYEGTGYPAERVFVAPNAVTGPPPDLLTKDVSDQPSVLFVGRLQARKRVDLLLRACSAQESRPRLSIVGDGPARADLEGLARQVYPGAEFMGARGGEDLKGLFRSADIFVLPGTGGLAVQQAMAHGLPVIVAEGDGSQRDLVGSENGWLIPPGDLPALTAALKAALQNRTLLPEMGAASHRIVAERVNIEVMADIFLSALERTGAA